MPSLVCILDKIHFLMTWLSNFNMIIGQLLETYLFAEIHIYSLDHIEGFAYCEIILDV